MVDVIEAKPFVHPNCNCQEDNLPQKLMDGLNTMSISNHLVLEVDGYMHQLGMCRRQGVMALVGAACSFATHTWPDGDEAKKEVMDAIEFYFAERATQLKIDDRLNESTANQPRN